MLFEVLDKDPKTAYCCKMLFRELVVCKLPSIQNMASVFTCKISPYVALHSGNFCPAGKPFKDSPILLFLPGNFLPCWDELQIKLNFNSAASIANKEYSWQMTWISSWWASSLLKVVLFCKIWLNIWVLSVLTLGGYRMLNMFSGIVIFRARWCWLWDLHFTIKLLGSKF